MKSMKKTLGIVMILVLIFGAMMPLEVSNVYAEDQIPYGSEGIVAYEHDGLEDGIKRVTATSGGNYAAASDIYGPGNYQYVYCINPSRSATSNENWNANFRWRWNLTANPWLLDNNKRNLENPDLAPGSAGYDRLVKVLYAGYPYNGANLDPAPTYGETQDAVFHVVCGTGSANAVVDAADAEGFTVPANTTYMYLPDSDAKQTIQNTVGLAVWETPDEKPEDEPSAPTGSVSFRATKRVEGEGFELDREKAQFIFRMYLPEKTSEPKHDAGTDDNGWYHTRNISRDTSEEDPYTVFFGELSFGPNDVGTKEIRFREIRPDEEIDNLPSQKEMTPGMIYDKTEFTITLEVKQVDGEIVITQNDVDVTGQTIDVGEWVNMFYDGKLKTTVSVDDKSASEGSPVETEAGTKDVIDYIDYEGLIPGATYKVQGTLIEVDSNKEIATSDADCAEQIADESGSGKWEIKFSNVTLEEGKKYVVFEEATPIKDKDGEDITDATPIEHKDPEDNAQTIVVNVPSTGSDTIDIKVTKLWDDWRNFEGHRPKEVTIVLYQNGEKFKECTLTSEDVGEARDEWVGEFKDLPIKDDAGKEYEYTVDEEVIDWYDREVSGDVENGFVINNINRPWTPQTPRTPGEESKYGEFTIQKTVSGLAEEDKEYEISMEFTLPDGTTKTLSGPVRPKDGKIGADYVLAGTKVKVSELTTGYTVTYTVDGEKTQEFEIAEGDEKEVVINNYLPPNSPGQNEGQREQGEKKTGAPKTGDETNIGLWIFILLSAALLAAIALKIRRRA